MRLHLLLAGDVHQNPRPGPKAAPLKILQYNIQGWRGSAAPLAKLLEEESVDVAAI